MRELTEEVKQKIKDYIEDKFPDKDFLFKKVLQATLEKEYINDNFEVE